MDGGRVPPWNEPTRKMPYAMALGNFARLAALICLAGLFLPALLRAQTREEQILFDDANRERTQRGLSPLKWDAQLAAAAQQHASLMAQQNTLSHQLPGEPEPTARARAAGARFSALAENVADGPSVGEIHEGWMNSPPHRKNLLDPELNSVRSQSLAMGSYLPSRISRALSLRFRSTSRRAGCGLNSRCEGSRFPATTRMHGALASWVPVTKRAAGRCTCCATRART